MGLSSTEEPISLAVPHIVVEGQNIFKIILVRAKTNIIFGYLSYRFCRPSELLRRVELPKAEVK